MHFSVGDIVQEIGTDRIGVIEEIDTFYSGSNSYGVKWEGTEHTMDIDWTDAHFIAPYTPEPEPVDNTAFHNWLEK